MHTVTLHFTASNKGNDFLAAVGEVLTGDEPSICTKSKIKDRVICTYMVEAPGSFDAVDRLAERFAGKVVDDRFKLVYVRSNGVTRVLYDPKGKPEWVDGLKARITSDPADRQPVVRRTRVERDPRIDRSDPVQAAAEDAYNASRTVEERIASAMDEARELVEEAF